LSKNDIFLVCFSVKGDGMRDYDFAGHLKEARQRAGWSQTELGKRSGVHAMAISRLERGDKKDVTGATLRKLSIALGVSADWLLGLVDDEKAVVGMTAAMARDRKSERRAAVVA
jgi:transcriptional regulator with XRE-family HTH domain